MSRWNDRSQRSKFSVGVVKSLNLGISLSLIFLLSNNLTIFASNQPDLNSNKSIVKELVDMNQYQEIERSIINDESIEYKVAVTDNITSDILEYKIPDGIQWIIKENGITNTLIFKNNGTMILDGNTVRVSTNTDVVKQSCNTSV